MDRFTELAMRPEDPATRAVGVDAKRRYRPLAEANPGSRKPMTLAERIDDDRWSAVSSRVSSEFFYAVRTTGVFCRTDCASRRPRRENVEYFDSPEAALRAGYRACRRCHPLTTQGSRASEAIVEACRILSEEPQTSSRTVAATVGLSTSYFQRTFKKQLGVTPRQYQRRVLAERARDALGTTRSVTEAVYRAGYSSSSRFYDGVGRELGMKPAQARSGGRGETIRYATMPCSLGWILVGWTDRGVCEVALGDAEELLREQLEAHFPRATLETGSSEWANAIVEAVDHTRAVDVPLDIRGTAFQERVWQVLREVPVGETRTYAQIAALLGSPKAARAVARACATNRLAVVVPCHRVVRKDGTPSGYRWGLERKRALLDRERS